MPAAIFRDDFRHEIGMRFGRADVSYVSTQFNAVVIRAFVHESLWIVTSQAAREGIKQRSD